MILTLTITFHNRDSVLELAKQMNQLTIEQWNVEGDGVKCWDTAVPGDYETKHLDWRVAMSVAKSKLASATKRYDEAFAQWEGEGFPE